MMFMNRRSTGMPAAAIVGGGFMLVSYKKKR